MPTQFLEYFRYLHNLQYDKRPDYTYLHSLFDQLWRDLGFAPQTDDDFDWIQQKKKLLERRQIKEAEEKLLVTSG